MVLLIPLSVSCGMFDLPEEDPVLQGEELELLSLEDVAGVFSAVDIGSSQVREVYDAVSSSAGNGYDSEYTMAELFDSPGSGVGDDRVLTGTKAGAEKSYERPLRDLLVDYFASTRAQGNDYLSFIKNSGFQIYWPYFENWDGRTMPVITFDPSGETKSNIGYIRDRDGNMQEVTVTEEMARERPVWVINQNSDASFTSLEVMRKNHPEWGEGGLVKIEGGVASSVRSASGTKAVSGVRTLLLKDFTMLRQFDSWFAGASEFFVKIGAVESFHAATEAEMQLYNPSITDFIIVVRRDQVNVPQVLNTVLVSEWTDQLENAAFMIVEDDGGTVTSWTCNATVKYNSKSYGFELTIPYRSRDDIVWRGQLSRNYLETNNLVKGRFGDVSVTFEIVGK